MYWQHTLEFNSMLNDCGEMFCEVSEAAAKTNSILKWVKVRNCSYKTNIVKMHAGIHCWLLGEGEGISSSSNKHLILVTDVVHLESKLLHVPGVRVSKITHWGMSYIQNTSHDSKLFIIDHDMMNIWISNDIKFILNFWKLLKSKSRVCLLPSGWNSTLAWNLHGTWRFHTALN